MIKYMSNPCNLREKKSRDKYNNAGERGADPFGPRPQEPPRSPCRLAPSTLNLRMYYDQDYS